MRATRTALPAVARTRGGLARGLAGLRRAGGSVALVPTMGALHDGHAELIRRAHVLADSVVVTIFVNPLQFGAGEDLHRYPRTLDADLRLCAAERVSLVWAPSIEVVYPTRPVVTVAAGELGDRLEGRSRPGHFDGVLTVVAKMLHLTAADVAVFGDKDAQQLVLIRRMVRDLDLPVHVVGVPTVRDPDGLAVSSRNRYLDPDARAAAPALSRALRAGSAAATDGAEAVRRAARAVLGPAAAVRVDYLALVDPEQLVEVPPDYAGPALLAVAAFVDGTRLIDNVALTLPDGSAPGPVPDLAALPGSGA